MVRDDDFLVLFNASPESLEWRIPAALGEHWELVLDTAAPIDELDPVELRGGDSFVRPERSLAVLLRRIDE